MSGRGPPPRLLRVAARPPPLPCCALVQPLAGPRRGPNRSDCLDCCGRLCAPKINKNIYIYIYILGRE
eukprot:9099980-Heterocapsa_arctica.AAC.1